MKEEDLKWYSPVVFLVGAILSFADPITDILTLVEFYRADHKTWFGVGLTFVVLPCLVFPILYLVNRDEDLYLYSNIGQCARSLLCGFHPFSAAFARLEGFVYCLKKRWRGDEIDSDNIEAAESLLTHMDLAVLFESVLEAAPQFIIQLYAVNVQEEPVKIIQMISLPISFLSLAWAFTTIDEFVIIRIHRRNNALKIKQKLAIFGTQLFLLSSRLFAVCYFTVSYKWWVIGVLLSHTLAIVVADSISLCITGAYNCAVACGSVPFLCLHWLIDDFSLASSLSEWKNVKRRMQLFSNVLFVVENFVMIFLFYFSQHTNTWYSLPVTVCVCLFSVVGSVMRVIVFYFLLKDQSDDTVKLQANNSYIDSPFETLYWISTV